MDNYSQNFNPDSPKPNESEGEYLANDCRDQRCPQCGQGILDYNGLLDLVCPVCGYREPGGSFT